MWKREFWLAKKLIGEKDNKTKEFPSRFPVLHKKKSN